MIKYSHGRFVHVNEDGKIDMRQRKGETLAEFEKRVSNNNQKEERK